MSHEEAQEYLEAENDGCELVYVKACQTGYHETQRYREGQKFFSKKKYLPNKWMEVLEGGPQASEDEEELVKFLADDDHQDELITLEGKLKAKKIAST